MSDSAWGPQVSGYRPPAPQYRGMPPTGSGWGAPPQWAPRPPRRRRWWLFATPVAVVVLLAGVLGAYLAVAGPEARAARSAAGAYLGALERGDGATAYGLWCAKARAAYPEAEFRAQHEWRQGRAVQLGRSVVPRSGNGSVALVSYRIAGEGAMRPLAMRRSDGHWEVCPSGQRLQQDMQNCGCMTPGQHLEADVASVLGHDHDLVEVNCPPQVALVDGVPVPCTGTGADGNRWSIVATESGGATYTSVRVTRLSS